MTFPGVDNQSVELKIVNYQFPHTTLRDDYDANWLHIYLNVKSKCGHWQTVDPSLLTSDVEKIIKWLSDLANNKSIEDESLEFIEPNLSFHMLCKGSEVEKIRIQFDLESRPQSFKEDVLYFVDSILSNSELQQLSCDMTAELAKFPKR